MSRMGQFEEGKQTLVIGLDVQALQSTDKYRCYIGKNRKDRYEIDYSEALRYASEHTIWTNRQGRKVAILPLNLFDKKSEGGENK